MKEVRALINPSVRMPEKLFVNALVVAYTIGRMPDAYWSDRGRAEDFAHLIMALAQDIVASGSVSRMDPWLRLLPFVFYKSGQEFFRLLSEKEVLIICTAVEAGKTPRKSPHGMALQSALLGMAAESELAARFALPEAEFIWKEVVGAAMRNFQFKPGKGRTEGGFSTFRTLAAPTDDPAAPHFAAANWLAGHGLPGLPGEQTWQFLAHPPQNELSSYLGGRIGEGSNHPLRTQALQCCGPSFEPAPFGLPTTGVHWNRPKPNQPGSFEPDLLAGRRLTARNIAQLALVKVNKSFPIFLPDFPYCFEFSLSTNSISLQMPDAQHCSDLKMHSNLTRSVQAVGLHLQRRPETHQLYHQEGAATKEGAIQTPAFGMECAGKWQKPGQTWPVSQEIERLVWLHSAAALQTTRGRTFHWSAALSHIHGRAGDLGARIKGHLEKQGLLPKSEPETGACVFGGQDIRQPPPKPDAQQVSLDQKVITNNEFSLT